MYPEIRFLHILKQFKSQSHDKLYLHAPFLKKSSVTYLEDCIKNNEISAAGSYITKFENSVAKICNTKYAVSVNSGTSALHVSLITLGVKPGDEVFIPNLTFIATANAVRYCDAIPHFVEIEEDTLGIDVNKLDKYIEKNFLFKSNSLINRKTGKKVSAIIGVYVFGKKFDSKGVNRLAKKYSLKYIEDAAGALGTISKKESNDNQPDLAIISFNGNKVVSSGNGGVVLTNNEQTYEYITHLKSTAKINSIFEFDHDLVGFNYRLSNINAALGFAQLEYFDEIISIKRNIMRNYKDVFFNEEWFRFMYKQDYEESNNWLNTILLSKDILNSKNEIIATLNQNGIEVRSAWNLVNSLKPYKQCPTMETPIALDMQKRIINIPSGNGVITEH